MLNVCETSREIVIEPAARQWLGRGNWPGWQQGGNPLNQQAIASRVGLGLDADRPVIMTGHQAGFWHPGILVKYLGAEILSDRLSAQPAWL